MQVMSDRFRVIEGGRDARALPALVPDPPRVAVSPFDLWAAGIVFGMLVGAAVGVAAWTWWGRP
jgi:hypothetical protein